MATQKDPLVSYRKKRDFNKTTEPIGGKLQTHKEARFVIHKHAASHLHYDFRLEIDGVLASWAVPKGPSLNPSIKRLAIMTEDHPLDYIDFEGVIPQGSYGGGTVMVWDTGTYRNIKEKDGKAVSLHDCLKQGRIEIFLEGKKLQGAFALVRMERRPNEWLLIKMRDEYADARANPVNTQKKSALTDRTMLQIKHDATVDEN